MSDLFAPIERNAAFDPEKTAIRFADSSLSYAALAERVQSVAAGLLRDGVKPGDRVALLAYNHPDFLTLLYAAARIGAILTPLNWRLADAELAYALSHAEPVLLAHDAAFAETAARLMPRGRRRLIGEGGDLGAAPEPLADTRDPAAAVLMVYTSGTTGRPKGALLSSAALIGNALQSHHMHQMTAADHVLAVLPMFHVGGLNIQSTPALMAGATLTIHERFDPAATLAAIVADRPSLTVLVPATLTALLALPEFAAADLSALRAVTTGSTIVPEELIAAFEARGIRVLCVYGATETCPIAAYDRAGLTRTVGGTGRAGLLARLRIIDDGGKPVASGVHGEIAVAGAVFSGYFRDEAATRAGLVDGFVRTGDIGSLSADGTLTVHDRKKNMIVSGGENIYPAEVERVLGTHPAVAECAVVGKSDPRWQEVPVAFIVASAAVTADEITAHCAASLARYKVPRDVRFVASLPRTALGKVQHELLRAEAAGAVDPESARGLAPAAAKS